MASEILYAYSTNELSKEIQKLVGEDQRSLPQRSKVFSAVAKIQRFDVLPELVGTEDLNQAIAKGAIELNRGIASTKGVPSQIYARDLVFGPMYPGTLTALGNGIYFAVPSIKDDTFLPNFPLISKVALKYTKGEATGTLIRVALKHDSKIADCDDLKQDLRENKNRCKSAGITDVGTYAAALGFDAYYADGIYDDSDERIYTVLNRGSILVQKTIKLINQ